MHAKAQKEVGTLVVGKWKRLETDEKKESKGRER
jgi:hypothetical protein